MRITIQYADINPTVLSMGSCVSCGEPIDGSDGPKYIIIGFPNIIRFHEPCFMDFNQGVLEFIRIYIKEKRQQKYRKEHVN